MDPAGHSQMASSSASTSSGSSTAADHAPHGRAQEMPLHTAKSTGSSLHSASSQKRKERQAHRSDPHKKEGKTYTSVTPTQSGAPRSKVSVRPAFALRDRFDIPDLPSGSSSSQLQAKHDDQPLGKRFVHVQHDGPPSRTTEPRQPLKSYDPNETHRGNEPDDADATVSKQGRQDTHGPDEDDEEEEAEPEQGWFSFTLPTRIQKRAESYWRNSAMTRMQSSTGSVFSGREGRRRHDSAALGMTPTGDIEKSSSRHSDRSHPQRPGAGKRSTGSHFATMWSAHQATTPGWSKPWEPFQRHEQTQDPFDAAMKSATDHDPDRGPSSRNNNLRWQNFILYNPFAPLIIRFVNLSFTSTVLAVAVRTQVVERHNNLIGVLGSSILVGIIICPITIVHIFISVYLEYFGKPIGLWRVRLKMTFSLVELVFIALWAAELALCIDSYISTPLYCTSYLPYARFQPRVGDAAISGTAADVLCKMQGALIALVLISLLLYCGVLVITLYRIVNMVARKSRSGAF
ncbi:uncharacterized protein L969DRAFT_83769 [Mixia osmundae IAM 14324]|uniref:Uncharacterized protein n=1 Tax=Mixia osmundae (strain CBS 9802 / IAM 14324 / JCM 22182 / KY 12970) TaxID=764103 RepID=G7E784_MIXOS|nr:uncharacterized protein L969DRAFT_83769 [Mixia osmundae IAM 14324]KEI41912.1 hypothetical protein L969DRAFT_83769 [Mixia osmundae IAM 14324]GAA98694.1 hypothetical protein E5Q_05382 [Mixia osmundae IAM 14324]